MNLLEDDEEDDFDMKDLVDDADSVESAAQQVVQAITASGQPEEAFTDPQHPWTKHVGDFLVMLNYLPRRQEWQFKAMGSAHEPFSVTQPLRASAGWVGPLSPKAVKAAAMRLFSRCLPEQQRRNQISQLYEAMMAAIAQDPAFKAWIESDLVTGTEDLRYQGHPTCYEDMTPQDIEFWYGVLKEHGH